MEKLVVSNEYFNATDTLCCGQIFRYREYGNGYLVVAKNKICYLYEEGNNTVIESDDVNFFRNFFDIETDYSVIVKKALEYGNKTLTEASIKGKGIRILKQDPFEMTFSFIISQNNNIKRIQQTIEKLCKKCGKKLSSVFGDYYAFPTATEMQKLTELDYKELGFGYRGRYFIDLLAKIKSGFLIEALTPLSRDEVYNELIKINGIGDKVANCITLFGFYKTDSFPVDTWIEKIYIEDFNGTLKDRKKMTEFFLEQFGIYSGYIQQYLFHYKRTKT